MALIRERLRAVGKLLTYVAATLALIWFVVFPYTMFKLLDAPLRPVKITGNVISWSNHGVIHYITRFQDRLQGGLWSSAVIIIALAFVGLFLYRGRQMFDQR